MIATAGTRIAHARWLAQRTRDFGGSRSTPTQRARGGMRSARAAVRAALTLNGLRAYRRTQASK
jgi:hypothetical protein